MRDSTIGSCRASLFLSAAFVLILGAEPGYAGGKVTICHFPPGNPEDAHTIAVGEPAVDAHLAHGDALGECAEPSSCGDDVVQGTEGCDGTDLGGHTCEDVLEPGATGTPSCTAACELTPDGCQLCGNGIVEGDEECDDGSDNGNTKPCTASCQNAICGDGLICSDPTCTSGIHCQRTCDVVAGTCDEPICTPRPEECDDGNDTEHPCDSRCSWLGTQD